MTFKLIFSKKAKEDLEPLERNKSLEKVLKAVHKALYYLETNPRHPSLNTHEIKAFSTQSGQKVYEAYAQNHTPGAYRIFWHYGPDKDVITIIAITPHP
ncbi:MAG: type II toxin-antitoxin system RelE/ParE family toxin [Heliobacteriaceae bacterium]|jgi:mRNA-degrading endonuclease RelE of RelBE toxin-antitoxin system|nr:type II toxin-antitoxin system RelE/ParE family toxin [Heliobacteriaceae bacterium]